MILSIITWDHDGDAFKNLLDTAYATAEIHTDIKEAWISIDQAKKIKGDRDYHIVSVEFFDIQGNHFE